MHESLFAYMENKGLHSRDANEIGQSLIKESHTSLVDMLEELHELVPSVDRQTIRATPFTFLANQTYAGFPFPCGHMDCRAERMGEMAYFATLYADRVWFPNPFRHLQEIEKKERLVSELAFITSQITRLRPLFDAGMLGLAKSQDTSLCRDCYAKLIGYPKSVFKERLHGLEEILERRYVDEVTYYIERRSQGRTLVVPRGPSSLIDDHYAGYRIDDHKIPKVLRAFAKTVKESAQVPRRVVRKGGIARRLAGFVVQDILNQNLYATQTGTGYLTNRGVDLEVLNTLAPNPVRKTNALLQANFAHELPVVKGIPFPDLLKVRRDEGEAFEVYRDALTKALHQVKTDEPARMAEVFADVVKPELHKLSMKMKSARRILVRDAVVDGAIATGFISVGLFAGILPANIGAVMAALGGYHFAERLSKKITGANLEPQEVRDSSYYFLWKVARHGSADNEVQRGDRTHAYHQ